jgi:hypothetical protein
VDRADNVEMIERQVGSLVGETSTLVKRFSLNLGLGYATTGIRVKTEPDHKGKGGASHPPPPDVLKRTIDEVQVEEMRLA